MPKRPDSKRTVQAKARDLVIRQARLAKLADQKRKF